MREENIEILKNGGVGVIPTDTIYGLVGSALKEETVKRITKIKNRSDGKGFIVLISSPEDLKMFGIAISETAKIFLQKFWPGKVSVAFDDKRAFRIPDRTELLDLLKQTGPLIAPSANPEGLPPAKNISDAKNYFQNNVDFYEDGGELNSPPSTLVRIAGDKVEVLRQGVVKVL